MAEHLDERPNGQRFLACRQAAGSRVVRAAEDIPVKIMLELPLLNTPQRERAVALSIEAGVAYLKNASGGAVGVATPEDIRFLRSVHLRYSR